MPKRAPRDKTPVTALQAVPADQPFRLDAVPWDRLPSEEGPQYAAFLQYRDLPPGKRVISELIAVERARRATDGTELYPLSDAALRKWSFENQWVDRAAAWDAYLRFERDQAAVAIARESTLKQAEVANGLLELSQVYYDTVRKRLDAGQLARLDFPTLLKNMPTAIRAAETGVKILRLINGQSTENLAVKGSLIMTPGGELDLSQLSDDQLRNARALLQRISTSPQVIEGEAVELPREADADVPLEVPADAETVD